MDKVLILGINGFTGRHFQEYIYNNHLEEYYTFIGVDKEIDNGITIDCMRIDLLEGENLQELIREEMPEYIMNFIGMLNSDDLNTLLELNARVSHRILETIVKHNLPVKSILFIGSAAEYGMNSCLPLLEYSELCPVSYYGLSKVIQTHYTLYFNRNWGINVNIARTFNIIGKCMPKTLSIPSFLKRIHEAKNGGSISVGSLNTRRDYLDISDVVDAYWKILLGGNGQIYNVCRGESDQIKDILNYLIKRSNKELRIVVKDSYVKKNDIIDSYGDNSKLIKDTRWNFHVGIYEALDKISGFNS